MVIEEKPGYAARLADCAEEASRRFLRRLGMGWGEIDLVVPAPSSPDFLDALVTRLGVPGDRVAYTTEDLEGAYTTGPIAALQAAIKSGRLGEARTTLMLAAGAGITVALALYRQEPPEFFIPAYPFWSLLIIALDVVALWGLCVYGSRENMGVA